MGQLAYNLTRRLARLKKLPGVLQLRRRYRHERADFIVISFPKSGRTWLRAMLGRALQQHYCAETEIIMRTSRLQTLDPQVPRILSTHDDFAHNKEPGQIVRDKRKFASKRVIFLVRNPRDVLVSLFFQKKYRRRRNTTYRGELSDYVYEKVGGIESIVTFYNVWAENRHVPRDFLMIRYEDMSEEPERELRRLLRFLGIDWLADETVAEAVRFASFDNLRNAEADNALKHGSLRTGDPGNVEAYKVRKGKVGGYSDYLGPAEIAYLNGVIRTQLSDYYDFYK